MKTEEIYQKLAESLAFLFKPMAEVALFNKQNDCLAIYNQITEDNLTLPSPYQFTKTIINKKNAAKFTCIPLEHGFYLRILVETSLFESLQVFLHHYLNTSNIKNMDIPDWQNTVEQLIENFLQEQQKSLSALNTKDKRALILFLHEKNIFRYQEASKYLATRIQVSRATIYNYLNQANQLRLLEIHQVDAFTDEPFCGNPSGVVLDADELTDALMKKITREMNLSETSFLLKSNKADIRLRYFTPTGNEVKFCGHSTVGALYMLAHKRRLGITQPGYYKFNLEAQVGILPVAIHLESDETVTVEFQTPIVKLEQSTFTHFEIADALGIPLNTINCQQPIMFEKTNHDIFITISSLKLLEDIHIDQRAAKQFAEKNNIVAYALLCNETLSKNSHIHMRCFAPAVGIPEDPFTGSVLGGLAAYITRNHLITPSLKKIRIEQGHFMGRPGYVELTLNDKSKDAPPWVTAKARHFFSTEIKL